VSAARFLIDTSGLFRILQKEHRAAWSDFLTAGVIAVCPVVELEFLFSAQSLADRLHKQRLLREVFTWIPMSDTRVDNWNDRSDDEPPYSRVPVPKKPNPNLPPLVMVAGEDVDVNDL